jgi:hypothetical protein
MLNTFLYKFNAGSATYRYAKVAHAQEFASEVYDPTQITHTAPTYSDDAQDAEIDVTIIETSELTETLLTPPPFPIILTIYEVLGETTTPYYLGWVVRCQFKLTESIFVLHLKTLWHFYERESLTDSLSSLSRFSIYDERSGADISALADVVTVAGFNDLRDVLTVTGAPQIPPYYKGGFVEAPNLDKRTILEDEIVGSDRKLTLNGGFPRFTLDTGFPASIYPGDDLTYDTWANKFSSLTNNGANWGGWQYTPSVDPAVRGVS